jgi:hypothetical protein
MTRNGTCRRCRWVLRAGPIATVVAWAVAGAAAAAAQDADPCRGLVSPQLPPQERDPGRFGGDGGAAALSPLQGNCAALWPEGARQPGATAGDYRACLMAQMPQSVLEVAELYVNGWGVRRNLQVARQLVCQGELASAEVEGIFAELADRANAKVTQPPAFAWCRHVTSGHNAAVCVAKAHRLAQFHRTRKLTAQAQAQPRSQQSAWLRIQKLHAVYATSHTQDEIDTSGSLGGANAIEAHDILQAGWTDWAMMALGHLPLPKDTALPAARTRLAELEERLQSPDVWLDCPGCPTHANFATTQRHWLRAKRAALAWARKVAPRARWALLESEWIEQRILRMQLHLRACERRFSPRSKPDAVCDAL